MYERLAEIVISQEELRKVIYLGCKAYYELMEQDWIMEMKSLGMSVKKIVNETEMQKYLTVSYMRA